MKCPYCRKAMSGGRPSDSRNEVWKCDPCNAILIRVHDAPKEPPATLAGSAIGTRLEKK